MVVAAVASTNEARTMTVRSLSVPGTTRSAEQRASASREKCKELGNELRVMVFTVARGFVVVGWDVLKVLPTSHVTPKRLEAQVHWNDANQAL